MKKAKLTTRLTAAILALSLLTVPAIAAAPPASAVRVNSYKGNTLAVGERSGLMIGPSGTEYTVTSSSPDTVVVEQITGFWVAVAKAEGTANITAANRAGESGTLTLTVGSGTPAAPTAPASGDSASQTEEPYVRQELVWLINQTRKANGVAELPVSEALMTAAQTLSDQRYTWHHTKEECEAVIASGYPYGFGINLTVFTGVATEDAAQHAHDNWLNSPGHFETMIKPDCDSIGVGVTESGGVTYCFMIVGRPSGSVKKDVRRQMTAKYVKELTQRQRNRGTSGSTDTAPEVQAAEQVEEMIYTTADSLRDRTATAVSKSISRHKKKQQKKKGRREQPPGEAPSTGAEVPPPPAGEHSREQPQEHPRERPADEIRTRPPEDSRRPAPMRERRPDTVRERPAASHPGPDRAPAGPTPKERMRHTAIKEKRNRQTDIRRRPADPTGQRQTSPPGRKPVAAQPKPQERMRQKAKAEAQTRRAQAGRVPTPPRPERQPAPRHIAGSTPASPGNQSINPIKERPRRSFAPKEKPTGGSFIPKTRQTAAASKSTAKAASAAAKKKTAARPLELAKRRVQRNAQRKLLRQSTAKAKTALDLSRKAAVMMAKAVSSLISAIAGLLGGAFLIPIICLIVLVAAIIASPFGILFANEPTPGAMPLNVAVGQLNMELANTLETMQTGDYDSIDIQGQGPDWREVVAVFAARTAGADDGIDVAALTPDRVDRLKAVFWDMCAITSEVETIPHPDSDPDDDTDDSWTERILHITITAKTAEDMRTEYAFTDYQNRALTELLAELSTMDLLLTDLSASQEQARNILRNLPDGLSPERRAVVETACKLVGKVNYFWGGKSRVIGWDNRWGTIQKVWADGSSTTGTYRPYGLDCSGFVDWVFYNISDGAYTIGHGGGAHAQHTYCTAITWAEAQPGDLVFYPEDSHVGIVGGWDESGNILIIHCASGYNNVVVTKQEGFTTIGRPLYYSE